MDRQNILIIGGGLSGLSAAVELCKREYKTVILEQNQYSGGRTHSFNDTFTGDSIDNGQHLMMGCYHATRRYMHIIKTDNLALLQPRLCIEFLNSTGDSIHFTCPPLPAPLHLLGGLVGFKGIPLKNRLEMLSVAKQLLYSSFYKEHELDEIDVEKWLVRLGQSDIGRKYFWDVITIGALNNHPGNVSALMLFRVLRAAFLGNRENSSLLITRAGLTDVLVDPAVDFIKQHGGDVLTGRAAAKFNLKDGKIYSVLTKDGAEFRADVFLCTVPWFMLNRLLCSSDININSVIKTPSGNICDLNRFKPSPIISIQLWFDRKVMEKDFAALIDTRVQWVFNKKRKVDAYLNRIAGEQKREIGQHLSLVISGAQEFVGISKKDLLRIALEDIQRVLPKTRDANIIHSIIIKEKRATFTCSPGLEAIRPIPKTAISNFFLAGDWTGTGLPATIESAVLSGKKAAELICL